MIKNRALWKVSLQKWKKFMEETEEQDMIPEEKAKFDRQYHS